MTPYRVLLLDTKRNNPNHYLCVAVERALRAHPGVECVIQADYRTAISAAQAHRCNLLIAFDGEELQEGIVSRVSATCGRSVLWVTEDPYERTYNQRNAPLFDLVFTNDAASAAAYGERGRHLPLAADPGLHFHALPSLADAESHYRYDLFFAGTAWPNRVALMKEMLSALEGLRTKLLLPDNPHIPSPDLDLPPSSYLWRTPNSEFARFANRSRATLTVHRAFSSSGNEPVATTPGPRLFEVALAGGFQLIDMSRPEIETARYFEAGKEFVGFSDARQCIEALDHYLAHEDERHAIARAAQVRAQAHHLYAHRVDHLLQEVASLPPIAMTVAGATEARGAERPRVLFVTHNVAGTQPFGGVEIYQDLIKRALGDRFEFLYYLPERGAAGHRTVLYNEHMHAIEEFEFPAEAPEAVLSCPDRERAFSSLLQRHRIQLVHFQHLIGHVPSLLWLPRALGIRSVLSLHDYYAICRHFNLIGYQGRYCNIANLPKATCDVCLNALDEMAAGSQARRRAFFGRALEQVDLLHANTRGVADLFSAIFPTQFQPGRVDVRGIPMPASLPAPTRGDRREGPLRVAILGNFTRNKGADQCIHAFNQMRGDDIEFTILGAVAEPYPAILQQLRFPNVVVQGSYDAAELPRLLAQFDASMHLSIWPETYCITLSEAWAAGLVPVVTDIGALGERVTDGVDGFKLPPGEAGAMIDLLRSLAADRDRLEAVRANISPALYVEAPEHMQWLSAHYATLCAQAAAPTRAASQAQGLSLAEYGIGLNQTAWPRHTRAPAVPDLSPAAPSVVLPPATVMQRALDYRRRHGLAAMVRRAWQELSGTVPAQGGEA